MRATYGNAMDDPLGGAIDAGLLGVVLSALERSANNLAAVADGPYATETVRIAREAIEKATDLSNASRRAGGDGEGIESAATEPSPSSPATTEGAA